MEFVTSVMDEMVTVYAPEPSNTTDVVWPDIIEYPSVRYSLVSLHIVAISLAALGNGFLTYIILKRRTHMNRNMTTYFVLNLAICDFIGATVYQPMRLLDILLPEVSGDASKVKTYCQVTGFFASFKACVAFHTIVAISQERLLLVCYPLKAKKFLTVRVTRWVLFLIWLLSFLVTLPLPLLFTFVATVRLSNTTMSFCMIDIVSDSNEGKLYFLILFCLYYAFPVIIVSVAYFKIFHTLRRSLDVCLKDYKVERLINTRKSLAKRMLCIAIIFTICQGPYFFTFLFVCFGIKTRRNPIFLLLIIEFLPLVASVMNPVVYSSYLWTIKRGFGSIITTLLDSDYSGRRHLYGQSANNTPRNSQQRRSREDSVTLINGITNNKDTV